MTDEIVKWADEAMFEAAPMKRDESGLIKPQVHLLSATPDPLGAVAAACRMYEGKPTYDLRDITDDERRHYWEQSLNTHLKAPWEFVDFHFFIEAVSRSFTHQMVRQRTAVFAQESLRFAVKEGFAQEVPLPPSLVNGDEGLVHIWEAAVLDIERAYERLVAAGVPAEDARGLLPHAVTTRLNYKTNLRSLLEHAGNRLCTQAQFEWRSVFLGIIKAIREYDPKTTRFDYQVIDGVHEFKGHDRWQFQLMASPVAQTFTPICYKVGKCPFQATFDRQCTIRERADRGAFDEINPAEWLADHTAGRRD